MRANGKGILLALLDYQRYFAAFGASHVLVPYGWWLGESGLEPGLSSAILFKGGATVLPGVFQPNASLSHCVFLLTSQFFKRSGPWIIMKHVSDR